MTETGNWLVRATQVGLTLILATAAFAKLLSTHDPTMWLSVRTYYLSAGAELAASWLLWTEWRHVTARCILALAVLATWLLWSNGRWETCGCMGSWYLDKRHHVVLLAAIGLLALPLTTGPRVPRAASES